jgi:hypothetical protein
MRRSLALALMLSAAPAAAATFVATTVETVARSSAAVVRGTVVGREARVTDDGRIVTLVRIAVTGAWKGEPDDLVTVVVAGGVVGRVGQWTDGAPSFEDGEDVVVFLAREGPTFTVSGHALGKYRVSRGEAHPDLDRAAILPRATPAGERLVGPMSVAELERRVWAQR